MAVLSATSFVGAGSTSTDANGRYAVELPSGSYKVQFEDCGGRNLVTEWYDDATEYAQARPVTVTAGTTTGLVDAQLARGGAISGAVTRIGGPGDARPCAAAQAVDVPGRVNHVHYAYPDASDGTYYVGALAAGTWRVSFGNCDDGGTWAHEYYDDTTDADQATLLTVSAGSVLSGIDAAVAWGGTVTGRVLGPDGAPRSGVCVFAGPTETKRYDDFTSVDGLFSIVVPAGDNKVQAMPCDGSNLLDEWYDDQGSFATATPVTVTGGAVTALAKDIQLSEPALDVPRLSIGDVTVSEGDAGSVVASVPVRMSGDSHQTVSVAYATGTGTAGAADHRATSGSIAFAPGTVARNISIVISPDSLDEPTESFRLTLSRPTNATISDGTALVRVVDNDPAPQMRASDVRVWEGHGGSAAASFTVRLSAPAADAVTVSYTTAGSSATSGTDFLAKTGSLTFTPGQVSKAVAVVVRPDTMDEVDETFGVTLSGLTGPATLADAKGVATVMDDDPSSKTSTPGLRIGDLTLPEGSSGSTTGSLTARLSTPAASTVTATYALAAGTAGSTDFSASTGTISIPAGASSATIPVTVRGDALDEPTERFTATLTKPTGATLGDATGTVTITDDDSAPRLAISDVTVNEGNSGSGSATVTVRLSAPAPSNVTVIYATADGTATAGSDYTAKTGTLTFTPGQVSKAIAITSNGDTALEASEAFTVGLANPTGATISDTSGSLTLRNDET